MASRPHNQCLNSMTAEIRHFPRMRLPSSHLRVAEMLKTRKAWSPMVLPPNVRLVIIGALVALSGFLYGLDTGSIGPITQMDTFSGTAGELSSSLQGFFVASILLSASISSFASGVIADKLSRRYGIGLGAAIFSVGAALSAASQDYTMLQVARLVTGIGAGQTVSVASIYLVEIAPSQIRGKLACMVQFALTLGIMVGYFLCYGTSRISTSLQWRLPFLFSSISAALLCISTLLFVPFSPRWLLQHGRDEQALAILRQLRLPAQSAKSAPSSRFEADDAQIRQELEEIKTAIAESRRSEASAVRFRELFSKRYRERTILGIILMSFQQLSGIDLVLYFAPIVFASLFRTQTASFLASAISAIVLVISTVPAQMWVDQWGRKPPMVLGGLGMAFSFLIVGSVFAKFGEEVNGEVTLAGGNAKWLVIVFIYFFLACFSCTWAVVTRVYASEIMPTKLRSRAAACQQLANWTTNFVVALTAPSFLRATPSGPYFFFAGTLLVTTAICAIFMKETKHKSLEEITEMFETRAA